MLLNLKKLPSLAKGEGKFTITFILVVGGGNVLAVEVISPCVVALSVGAAVGADVVVSMMMALVEGASVVVMLVMLGGIALVVVRSLAGQIGTEILPKWQTGGDWVGIDLN